MSEIRVIKWRGKARVSVQRENKERKKSEKIEKVVSEITDISGERKRSEVVRERN